MYYYKFNINDYISHTAHLDEIEDLAYRRMLDWYYLHEKPLPKSVEEIAKIIRMRTHSESIANVLRDFFYETENGFENNRANSEIISFNEKSDKAKQSAKARWGKNKNKNKKLKDDANALRTQCEGNAKHQTLNTKHNTQYIIPDGINLTAWEEWENYRKEKKKKISSSAATKQFNLLIKYPPAIQQQIINTSIQNDYQGLFPPKVHNENNQSGQREITDRSAAGQVRAAVERSRQNRGVVANDG